MKRALLIEPTVLDTSQLVSWGKQLVLFPAGCVPAHSDKFSELLLDRLDEIEYDCRKDAFVIAGKASKLARATALLCTNYDSPLFLYWNDSLLKYCQIQDFLP